MTDVKMFLFARWIAMCYADTQIEGISVLNKEDGHWYKETLNYFNETIYPEYLKNGVAEETRKFLEK